MKYYYVSYWYKTDFDCPHVNGIVLNEHPLKWMRDYNKEYPTIVLVSWQEISEEDYCAHIRTILAEDNCENYKTNR